MFNAYSKKSISVFLVVVVIFSTVLLNSCSQANDSGYNYYRKEDDNVQLIAGGEESIGTLIENSVVKTADENTSTFSIDVDTASYINFRRYIKDMTLKEFQSFNYSIRTEEAINYFDYDYIRPTDEKPFAVSTSVGECPWNSESKLAVINLAAKELNTAEQAGSNIVFLVDVSGSMESTDKLELLKKSLTYAIERLNENDTISIVTYASGVNTVLTGAKGTEKTKIASALNSLTAGGSTAGASGLETAYSVAEDYFIEGGNNRIILATDGEFNVGPSSVDEMKTMIIQRREAGIFMTVLGFGITYFGGDERLEVIADNGNGGYYVIDTLAEGEKVLCDQFTGSLYTVAKDVKIQVEFNKETVESYRLLGYENRVLSNEDFENDNVDAGDLGAGQTVTAIYEIVLKEEATNDLFSVKVRYKEIDSDESLLYEHTADISETLTDDYYFAAAVVEACLVVNNSHYKGTASISHAYEAAKEASGSDEYKQAFAEILKSITE